MENSRGRKAEKRVYEQSVEDEGHHLPDSKKAKMPALARFLFLFIHRVINFLDGCSLYDSSCYYWLMV